MRHSARVAAPCAGRPCGSSHYLRGYGLWRQAAAGRLGMLRSAAFSFVSVSSRSGLCLAIKALISIASSFFSSASCAKPLLYKSGDFFGNFIQLRSAPSSITPFSPRAVSSNLRISSINSGSLKFLTANRSFTKSGCCRINANCSILLIFAKIIFGQDTSAFFNLYLPDLSKELLKS